MALMGRCQVSQVGRVPTLEPSMTYETLSPPQPFPFLQTYRGCRRAVNCSSSSPPPPRENTIARFMGKAAVGVK